MGYESGVNLPSGIRRHFRNLSRPRAVAVTVATPAEIQFTKAQWAVLNALLSLEQSKTDKVNEQAGS